MSQSSTFKKGTKIKYVYKEQRTIELIDKIDDVKNRLVKLEENSHPPVAWMDIITNLKHKVYVLIMKIKEMEGNPNGLRCNCKNSKRSNERKQSKDSTS